MDIKQKLKTETSARDAVFNHTLSYFKQESANILEIGCLRDLGSRAGDGWSTLHWANYVEKYGGSLVICDINSASIDICHNLIKDNFNIWFNSFVKDGSLLIDHSYTFIYLDGGDDPTETLNQFNRCNLESQIVLIDDFHTKGVLVDQYYKGEKTLFNFTNDHKMALFGKGIRNEEVIVKV